MRTLLILAVLVATILSWATPGLAQEPSEETWVTVNTLHRYSEEHPDVMLRQVGVGLTATHKGMFYELPTLTEPLTLRAVDGAMLTVTVSELSNQISPYTISSPEVKVELRDNGNQPRYQLRVEVPLGSAGVVIGYLGDVEVGKILLLERNTPSRTILTVALGGLWGEWRFNTATYPSNVTTRVAVISQPDANGNFEVSPLGWQRVLPADPVYRQATILPEEWLEGGYMAFRVSFPR